MDQPTFHTLLRKLERLERENRRAKRALARRLDRLDLEGRRLKRWGAAWLAAITAVALGGIAAVAWVGLAGPRLPARVIEAERFVLRDARGRARAGLGLTAAGLVLFDRNATPRASLHVAPDGAGGLALGDPDGIGHAVLAVEVDGSAHLGLSDTKDAGRDRAWLRVRADGARELGLADRHGQERVVMAVDANGAPDLTLRGEVLFKAP